MMDRIAFVLRKIKNKILSPIYSTYQSRLTEGVKKGKAPVHIGFILDGNRRFATSKGMDRKIGHHFGAKKVEELLEWCYDIDVSVVTLYAFSTENFGRTKEEVKAIMELAKAEFEKILTSDRIHDKEVRVKAIGDLEKLPPDVIEAIKIAEENTKNYSKHFLNVCLAYGSKDEIVSAVKKIAMDVKDGKIEPEAIDYKTIRDNLLTREHPDPDMIIRTGGESRLSNFMLLQSAYAELFFIDIFLPDFRKIDFLRIIRDYQKSDRRYGK